MLMTTLLSAVTIGAFAAPAQAQDVDDEEIVVTGSRIVKKDFVSNSPIATVDAVQFERTFSINTENLLNTLPQTVPGFDRTSNNPGNGSATVDLRGIGANRTLVLVNGTRQIPFGSDGVVDLNTIPASLIENVEVLTGGASSVYGADAVAGVVNFIYKDDFEGVEGNVGYSITDEGDAGLFNIDATFGSNFDDGKGNVTFNIGYANREALFQGDRDFSEFAQFENEDGLFNGGSAGSLGTTFFGFTQPDGVVAFPAGSPGLDSTNGNGFFNTDGSFRPFQDTGNDNDFYNYAPVNFFQLPQERFTITSLGSYEINNHFELYGRASFSQNRVDSQLAPTPIFGFNDFSLDGNPFLTAGAQQILSDNFGNGVDTDGDGIDDQGNAFLGRRLTEVGPRVTQDINDAFQITLGLRGDINDDWNYDVYFQEGRTVRTLTQLGNVNRDRFQQGLLLADEDEDGNVDAGAGCADVAANGGTEICSPLNIFGAGNISSNAAAFINTAVAAASEFQQTVAQANVSGNLGNIGFTDDPIGVAIGAEYIEIESDFRPSQDLAANTIAGFNGSPPESGSIEQYSVYGELSIPVVSGLPFAERITLDLSGRYSDFDTTGGNFTYKVGGEWAFDDQYRVRGNFNRAVRAPNIGELFAPQAEGFPGAVDPCSANGNPSAAVQAVCIATGVAAGAVGTAGINTISGQVRSISGGNPNLDVETADTFTVGFVAEPNFVDGLSLSVDYYDIVINDAIAPFGGGAQEVLNTCFTDTVNGGAGSDFCNVITRLGGGLIDQIELLAQNVAQTSVAGIDIAAQYAGFDLPNGFGSLGFNYLGTINLENDFLAFDGAEAIECAGQFGGTCNEPDPNYRHRVTGNWNLDNVSAQLVWRYVGGVDDDTDVDGDGAPDFFVNEIGTEHYFDLSGSWDVSDNLTLTGGINNILENSPPILGDNQEQGNTFPATYDVLGRTFFASAKVRF